MRMMAWITGIMNQNDLISGVCDTWNLAKEIGFVENNWLLRKSSGYLFDLILGYVLRLLRKMVCPCVSQIPKRCHDLLRIV